MSDTVSSTQNVGLKPLRTWIPLILLPLMFIARLVPELVEDGPAMIWMVSAFGPFLLSIAIVAWWVCVSRAWWKERAFGLLALIGALVCVAFSLDGSMLGAPMIVITIPMGMAAFAAGLVACSRTLSVRRTVVGVLLGVCGFAFSTLLKNDGVWGNFAFGLTWRWTATAEEQFLASRGLNTSQVEMPDLEKARQEFEQPEWPGFRGPDRMGVQYGVLFNSDWKLSPPEELWRIQVGPAWSSFAVAGNYLVTQEQRGDEESIVCYQASSGSEVWSHAIVSRFFEALGGLGPRATPTIAAGYIYALGAEGWLVKLDALNGELRWKTDLRQEADREPPMWGFSSSPLVYNDLVVVHAGGKGNKGILAFNSEDGRLSWSVASGEQSYGSLQVVDIFGRKLLAFLSDQGAQLLEPATGAVALEYTWKHAGYRALQPQVLNGNKLLIPTGMGSGTRFVQLVEKEGALSGTEVWTSRNLKPDFNDLVVHDGYIYGFDNSIFTCIDLSDGSRKWKGGRYGKGQVLLLADSGLLLVLSEQGEVALLAASSDGYQELAKFAALDGKTWNHPVVVGDRLFIRNAREAACYRLPLRSQTGLSRVD